MRDPTSSRWAWRPGESATRLGAGYKANREVIEPILHLLADALALAALLRHRPTAATQATGSAKPS